MKERIITEIRRLGGTGVSMAELLRLPGASGNYCIHPLGDPNILIACDASESFMRAFCELLNEKVIELLSCSPVSSLRACINSSL
jgi:hypothetical protein